MTTLDEIKAMNEQLAKEKAAAQEAKEAMDNHTISLEDAGTAFSSLTDIVKNNISGLLDYSESIKKAGAANANTTSLNKETAQSFAFLTSQTLGASQAYGALGKTVNSSLIGDQFKSLWSSVSAGKDSFSKLIGPATSLLGALGRPGKAIEDLITGASKAANPMKALGEAVQNQIGKFTTNADNVVKLRDTYFQMMSASGGLNDALARSGPNLKNVNNLVGEQMNRINGATSATNLSKEQIIGYYMQLGKVPGALNEQIKTTEKAGGTLDGLIARTRLAAATGRDSKDVIDDTTTALRTYNIAGAASLIFVARMSELNSKFGMEFQDTQKYMLDTANTFKFIGNEAEGSAKMFNKLMTAFKETGLSAKASTELIQGITTQISKLSIAQKSFLSAQTGGPGGLVGGFQIEKMLREGKVDEVFDKMQTQMKRQFGKIVSIDEAAQSPQAAAQLVRQREMLKGGPLGQFADTDDKAQRILDAFKKGEKIDVKELSKGSDLLNKNLETGKTWQDKNITLAKTANDTLEALRDEGSKVTNTLLEGIFTSLSGKTLRNLIGAQQKEGTREALQTIKAPGERARDTSAVDVSRALRQAGRTVRSIPDVAKTAVSVAGKTVSTTAARESRTGVPAASNKEAQTGNYMDVFHKTQAQRAEEVRRWTAAQNAVGPDDRLGTAKTVGSVNTAPTTAAAAGTDRGRAGPQRGQQAGSIKFDPINIKVTVDASGVSRVEHNAHVDAAMNVPGGK